MNLIGQRVNHILPSGKPGKYGSGIIVDPENNSVADQISVKFDNDDLVRAFSYPECFGRYLLLCNPELTKQIEAIQEAYSILKEKCKTREKTTSVSKRPVESANNILNELDNMIGLNNVKQEVHMLTSFIQVNNLRKSRGLIAPNISKHLVLTGNPGTGKTTVARMIAHIYYSIGAIKLNKIVETNRAGLVAGYVGQTALKTKDVIKSALGGVLFIDEAYSLANGSNNDFGIEVIDTLLSALENNRDDLVVIVAGYEDKMKQFINMNPGLASRFNRFLHFEDYEPNDLMSIFRLFCERNEYDLQKDAVKLIEGYFQKAYETRGKDFGNARSVRNLFENAIANQAERIINQKEVSDEMLITLSLSDIEKAIAVA